jgi:hypothetical protein
LVPRPLTTAMITAKCRQRSVIFDGRGAGFIIQNFKTERFM